MPWQNQNGGGRGPWGQGPAPRGPQPPNIEDLFKRSQDRMRGVFSGGFNSRRGILIAIAVLLALWLFSGFYRVESDQQGVVLRFGKWVETTAPGLNYHLPYPIETVLKPRVTRINRVDIGFRSTSTDFGRTTTDRDLPEESLMLTGDENIIDIDFTVFWEIKDAGMFLFNVQDPDGTVKAVAESAMREVVGQMPLQLALTGGRQQIQVAVRDLMQKTLDDYGAGLTIREVNLQGVDPPAAVIDSFRDVQAARADQERAKNEAEAYSNDIVPRARGDAAKIVQDAEAYKQQVINDAEGEASRFTAIDEQYKAAKDVTRQRMYIETMESVLKGMDKIIVEKGATGGIVPYMALPELKANSGGSAPSRVVPPSGSAGAGGSATQGRTAP
jgi:membrane protease subunit HflK